MITINENVFRVIGKSEREILLSLLSGYVTFINYFNTGLVIPIRKIYDDGGVYDSDLGQLVLSSERAFNDLSGWNGNFIGIKNAISELRPHILDTEGAWRTIQFNMSGYRNYKRNLEKMNIYPASRKLISKFEKDVESKYLNMLNQCIKRSGTKSRFAVQLKDYKYPKIGG